MKDFRDVIDRWKSCEAFAADIGIKGHHARTMRTRNSIPDEYWNASVDAAARRGFHDITLQLLADLAERRWRDRQQRATAQAAE